MSNQFLYESLIPSIFIATIAYLCAEFIGRGKHIGKWYSFFMMLGLIPGIIGLIFSPSAKNKPTKANNLYTILALFLGLSTMITAYSNIDNLNLVIILTIISLSTSSIYCFELSKGNVENSNPKFYFDNSFKTNINFTENNTGSESSFNTSISNLTDLKDKGILTDEEYKEKVQKIEADKKEQDVLNSTEYKQLKSLYNSGVLTKDEFESKIEILKNSSNNQNTITKQDESIKSNKVLSFLDFFGKFSNDILVIDFYPNRAVSIIDLKSNISFAGIWEINEELKIIITYEKEKIICKGFHNQIRLKYNGADIILKK